MTITTPLNPGCFYHIYNRGNNGEAIFRGERSYIYFMRLYGKYIHPVAETFSYCLLGNHFHLLIRIREGISISPSHAFANLFGTYAKAFNHYNRRTGSLFEKPFKRILVNQDRYLKHLVVYIHRNPWKHGLIDDYRDWRFSSYAALVSDDHTQLIRAEVLDWFGGRAGFEAGHALGVDERIIRDLVEDDLKE